MTQAAHAAHDIARDEFKEFSSTRVAPFQKDGGSEKACVQAFSATGTGVMQFKHSKETSWSKNDLEDHEKPQKNRNNRNEKLLRRSIAAIFGNHIPPLPSFNEFPCNFCVRKHLQ